MPVPTVRQPPPSWQAEPPRRPSCAAAGALLFLVAPVQALIPLALLFGFALNGTSSVLYAAVAALVQSESRSLAFGLDYTLTTGAY